MLEEEKNSKTLIIPLNLTTTNYEFWPWSHWQAIRRGLRLLASGNATFTGGDYSFIWKKKYNKYLCMKLMLKNFSTKMAAKSIHLCCSVLVVCNHLVVKLRLKKDFLSADLILRAILSVIPVVWTLGPFLLWQSFEADQSGPLKWELKHARKL